MTPARRVAFDVLRIVESGGYASDLLRARAEKLKARDAALAHEIVFGVLRFQAQLDALIEHFSRREAAKLDREVRLALRIGIYQLRYLDRIPRHAAVTESVEMVKRAHKRSATGFANAVLRKVDRTPVAWKDRATQLSVPEWLLARWERLFGTEAAVNIARAFLKPPETYIRVPESRRQEAATLAIDGTEIPGCYRLRKGEAEGFRRQDISSQAIVGLLDLKPGERFLDLCAAPGNKSAQALETPLRAVASDISRKRLAALDDLPVSRVVCDGTRPLPFGAMFDKILVDAPCSGTGTIGRNPEIRWRVSEGDLNRHHARQTALIGNALAILAPGGCFVYATCSLEPEENETVVEEILVREPRVRKTREIRRLPGRDVGDGFWAAVLTSG
jgi:16S rRNA (cytosine967-C5)-methyltransferase